ncbi:hypothetical protein H6G48_21765 [Microcystis flos-aquae FACHB-1344]|uniref:Uncharacterized protein n=1 Tax=Microcystis flos-aquae FACHB-1344 TaxID=2692899 RepID=A0ABR8HX86_9CHRO|nr:hypothetical protein [Microcystis flos-aquae FACHB-1344]
MNKSVGGVSSRSSGDRRRETGDYFYLFFRHPTPHHPITPSPHHPITLHPTPHTPSPHHPTPYTLHPTPHHPTPHTPHPTPQSTLF